MTIAELLVPGLQRKSVWSGVIGFPRAELLVLGPQRKSLVLRGRTRSLKNHELVRRAPGRGETPIRGRLPTAETAELPRVLKGNYKYSLHERQFQSILNATTKNNEKILRAAQDGLSFAFGMARCGPPDGTRQHYGARVPRGGMRRRALHTGAV